MAKRTYEQKLLEDLRLLPALKWFLCKEPPDYDKFVAQVKVFIDAGEQFEFSEDYSKIRRLSHDIEPIDILPYHKLKSLPQGVEITSIARGDTEEIELKNGTKYNHTFNTPFYRVYKNGNLIAIET